MLNDYNAYAPGSPGVLPSVIVHPGWGRSCRDAHIKTGTFVGVHFASELDPITQMSWSLNRVNNNAKNSEDCRASTQKSPKEWSIATRLAWVYDPGSVGTQNWKIYEDTDVRFQNVLASRQILGLQI